MVRVSVVSLVLLAAASWSAATSEVPYLRTLQGGDEDETVSPLFEGTFIPTANGTDVPTDVDGTAAPVDTNGTAAPMDGNGTAVPVDADATEAPAPGLDIVTVFEVIANEIDLTTLNAIVGFSGIASLLPVDANYTVFAPTDEALLQLDPALVANLQTPNWGAHLTDLLAIHIVSGTVLSTDLTDGMVVPTLNMETITIGVGDTVTITSTFSNTSTVTQADLLAGNGVVHKVDSVLLPDWVGTDLIGLGNTTAGQELSTFFGLISTMSLGSLLDMTGGVTVFAPTNAAFDALPEGALDEIIADGQLMSVLTNHVLRELTPSTLVTDGLVVVSYGGAFNLTFSVNGIAIMVNDANILTANVLANNGIVHVIDKVLIAPFGATEINATVSDIPMDTSAANAFVTTVNTPVQIPSRAGVDEIMTVVDWPLSGSIRIDNGTITYIPALGFVGADSFNLQICSKANPSCRVERLVVTVQQASVDQAPAEELAEEPESSQRLSWLALLALLPLGVLAALIWRKRTQRDHVSKEKDTTESLPVVSTSDVPTAMETTQATYASAEPSTHTASVVAVPVAASKEPQPVVAVASAKLVNANEALPDYKDQCRLEPAGMRLYPHHPTSSQPAVNVFRVDESDEESA